MPRTHTPAPIDDVPGVLRLADLAGIERDLAFAHEVSKHLVEVQRDPLEHHHLLGEALFTAAIIRYARCFSGVRLEVRRNELLDGLTSEQTTMHEAVMEIRSRHVAHSVNALEEGFVDAMVSDDPQQIQVEQISTASAYFAAFSGPSLAMLIDLTGVVLERVGQLIQAQKEVVLTGARRLDYQELRVRPMRTLPRFDWASICKARKRPNQRR